MKQTIYIDSALTPRYSPNGWPDKKSFVDYENDFHVELYDEALAKAKAESFTFESVRELDDLLKGQGLIFTKDTFIEVEIGEVEICYQRDFSSTFKEHRFEDVTKEAYENYSGPYAQRRVARLKKQENAQTTDLKGSTLTHPNDTNVASIDTSPNEHAMALIGGLRVDKANFLHIAQTGKINGGLLADLRHILIPVLRELNAEQATRKKYEELMNRFTPPGLKSRILERFNTIDGMDNPYSALEQVLDELKIK